MSQARALDFTLLALDGLDRLRGGDVQKAIVSFVAEHPDVERIVLHLDPDGSLDLYDPDRESWPTGGVDLVLDLTGR